MKAHISDEGTLVIEGENATERMALIAWEDSFADGNAAFRIGQSEAIQRADEDVAVGRSKPRVKRVNGEWVPS